MTGNLMNSSSQQGATGAAQALTERFGEIFTLDETLPGLGELASIARHRSHRKFAPKAVAPNLLRLLFACALSAPSKSDLQQADIIHVADRNKIKIISDLIPDMPWIGSAPVVLVFCGNNRRIRQIGDWCGKPFANDHLDHFMNAAVDAGIVLMNFIRSALYATTLPGSAICWNSPTGCFRSPACARVIRRKRDASARDCHLM
jgi:FMN reductase [NAD(P)H]